MTPLRATRYSKSHVFQQEPIHCDVDHRFGRRDRYKLENVESYANEERFFPQRPIRLFGVVSDGLKMIFPHATTRPLKAMEAYRAAVTGLHRNSHTHTSSCSHTHTITHTHTRAHALTHTHTHTHAQTRAHRHTHTHTHTNTHTHTQTHTHTHTEK